MMMRNLRNVQNQNQNQNQHQTVSNSNNGIIIQNNNNQMTTQITTMKTPMGRDVNHENQIIQDFGSLLTSGLFSDVTYVVGEREFKLHKGILGIRSKYFADQMSLETTWKVESGANKRIHKSNTDAITFEKLVKWIYTGHATLTNDTILSLFLLADECLCTPLASACCDYMRSSIVESNVLAFWELARQYQSPLLVGMKEICEGWLAWNFKQMASAESRLFFDFPEELWVKVLERSDIDFQEYSILQIVVQWANEKNIEIPRSIVERIRFPIMSPEQLKLCEKMLVQGKSVVSRDDLFEAFRFKSLPDVPTDHVRPFRFQPRRSRQPFVVNRFQKVHPRNDKTNRYSYSSQHPDCILITANRRLRLSKIFIYYSSNTTVKALEIRNKNALNTGVAIQNPNLIPVSDSNMAYLELKQDFFLEQDVGCSVVVFISGDRTDYGENTSNNKVRLDNGTELEFSFDAQLHPNGKRNNNVISKGTLCAFEFE